MFARSLRRIAGATYAAAVTAAVPTTAILVAACDDAKAPTEVAATQLAVSQRVVPHLVTKSGGKTTSGALASVYAHCPLGEWVFGGGYTVGEGASSITVPVSRPFKVGDTNPPTGWNVELRTVGSAYWSVWMICGRY